ncbi:hypothetical protein PVAND_006864 [Polypedilum vanderplanki]|uniref:F-box domain-containing protein n=1 Tax=Polypedilum vanderplanki TaxID=319348 RepID=A0A9J6C5F6_POLVA|nr:hypothetical protein PVAND_006864 [Polypedilum vanderplanki]
MDFVNNLPVELGESIFQHLTFEKLLECTLVSKSWNTFIGKSSKLMKKIIYRFYQLNDRRFYKKEYKDAFYKSQRMYQHIEIIKVSQNYIEEILDMFRGKIGNVKTLKLKELHFNNTKDVADFIEYFEPTIEEIELDRILVNSIDEYERHKFERLKVLRILNIDCDINCSSIFVMCSNLIELRVTTTSFTIKYKRPILVMLEQNEKLKTLELSLPLYHMILTNEILEENDEVVFKLNTFIGTNRYTAWPLIDYDDFFMTQLNSLEKLSLAEVNHLKNIEIIFKMPKLKELHLGNVEKFNMMNLTLTVNKSIEKISFMDMNNRHNTMYAIVCAIPNVKEMKIYSLTQYMMEFMSKTLKCLRNLKMRTIDAQDLTDPNLFPQLEMCSVEVVNSDLDDHMWSIPVENSSKLVQLILASNYLILH